LPCRRSRVLVTPGVSPERPHVTTHVRYSLPGLLAKNGAPGLREQKRLAVACRSMPTRMIAGSRGTEAPLAVPVLHALPTGDGALQLVSLVGGDCLTHCA
jgi:hypothetical protein